jgi:hypothetical protein
MSFRRVLLFSCYWLFAGNANAQTFQAEVKPLIDSACMDCHDANTKTDLNLQTIGYDLREPRTFQRWERIFERVSKGEMPPASADRPNPLQLKQALRSLQDTLRSISRNRQRRIGRVPARRLTKREYQYTLRDLLHIVGEVGGEIPDEVESGRFDTVGAVQRISAVHMQSYLRSADMALDLAIHLDGKPYRRRKLDFVNNAFLNAFHDKPLNLGGSIRKPLDSTSRRPVCIASHRKSPRFNPRHQ